LEFQTEQLWHEFVSQYKGAREKLKFEKDRLKMQNQVSADIEDVQSHSDEAESILKTEHQSWWQWAKKTFMEQFELAKP
jgi:hypothetical protein